jgi:hypothetical protein
MEHLVRWALATGFISVMIIFFAVPGKIHKTYPTTSY